MLYSFDRKTTELIQLFQYTITRSLMIFNDYVRMNNIITRKIEHLRALITLAVCTRPNFSPFHSVAFLRCENLARDEATACMDLQCTCMLYIVSSMNFDCQR